MKMKRSYNEQNPNAGFQEHHESHYELAEVESPTFLDWYESRLLRFTTQGDKLSAHILKQCYYKILQYQISRNCEGCELSEHQLILLCSNLHQQYCKCCYL